MIPDEMEEAVKAPVVFGAPVNGVCTSEVKYVTVGGAEVEELDVWRACNGDAEVKGKYPNALNKSR